MKKLITLVLVFILIISSLFVLCACNKEERTEFEAIKIEHRKFLSLKLPSDFTTSNYCLVVANSSYSVWSWDAVFAPVYSWDVDGSSSFLLLVPNETIYVPYEDFERLYFIKPLSPMTYKYELEKVLTDDYMANLSNYKVICEYIF